ncbi:hypothetical protein Nmel_002193 [Mimus melanotis]
MLAWSLFRHLKVFGVSHQVLPLVPIKTNFSRPTCDKEREQTSCIKIDKLRPVGLAPSVVDALCSATFSDISVYIFPVSR